MRKLIETAHKPEVTCDSVKCDYTVSYTEKEDLRSFINKPCPKCGENLCTQKDYDDHMKVLRAVNWVNKWFSWVTIFSSKPKPEDYKTFEVYTHKGIKITEVKEDVESSI